MAGPWEEFQGDSKVAPTSAAPSKPWEEFTGAPTTVSEEAKAPKRLPGLNPEPTDYDAGIAGTMRFLGEGAAGTLTAGPAAAVGAVEGLITGQGALEGALAGMERTGRAVGEAIDYTGFGTSKTAKGVQNMETEILEKAVDMVGEGSAQAGKVGLGPLGLAGAFVPEEINRGAGEVIMNALDPWDLAGLALARRGGVKPAATPGAAPKPEITADTVDPLLVQAKALDQARNKALPADAQLSFEEVLEQSVRERNRDSAQVELDRLNQQQFAKTGDTQDMFKEQVKVEDTGIEPPPPPGPGPIEPSPGAKPESTLSMESPAQEQARLGALPWNPTLSQYFHSRFPELAEKIAADPSFQKMMKGIEDTLDRMVAIRDTAQSALVEGTYLREGVQVKKETRAEYAKANESFMKQYDYASTQITELGNSLRDYAKSVGMDIRDRSALSDWINERADSMGPRPDPFTERLIDLERAQTRATTIEKTTARDLGDTSAFDPWRAVPEVEKAKALKDMGEVGSVDISHVAVVEPRTKYDTTLQRMVENGATLKELLTHMAQNSPNRWHKWGARTLNAMIEGTVTTGIGETAKVRVNGVLQATAATFNQKSRAIIFAVPENVRAHIILHEAFHAVTIGAFAKYHALSPQEIAALKDPRERTMAQAIYDLEDLRARIERQMIRTQPVKYDANGNRLFELPYGLSSGWEFLPEIFTNSAFQQQLDKIPSRILGLKDNGSKSAWKKALGYLADLLGMRSIEETAFDRAFKTSLDIINHKSVEEQLYWHPSMENAGMAKDRLQQIKDQLPQGMKHMAQALYDAETAKVPAPANVTKALELSGVDSKLLDGFNTDTIPYKEAREGFTGVKDISAATLLAANEVVPGGRMVHNLTNHPLIGWAVNIVDNMKRQIHAAQWHRLQGEDGFVTKFQQLSEKEMTSLHKVVMAHHRTKWLTDSELKASGLNEKQIEVYNNNRRHYGEVLAEINAERLAMKLDPIKSVPGYWPARWKGNFQMSAYDAMGTLLHIERGNNRAALQALADKLAKDGYDVKVDSTPRRGSAKDTYGIFETVMDTMQDSHERTMLAEAVGKYAQELADQRKGFRKHLQPIAGVGGFKGAEMLKNETEQALSAVEAATDYFNSAYDWIHTKRAAREMMKMLYDQEVQAPHAKAYIQKYWNNAQGFEGKLAHEINRIFEKLPEIMGWDRDMARDFGHWLRKQGSFLMLGYLRPVFLVASRLQPFQFMPAALSMLEAKAGKSASFGNSALGLYDALEMKAGTKDARLLEIKKYLEDNRVIQAEFFEGVFASDNKLQKGKNVWEDWVQGGRIMKQFETDARLQSFMAAMRTLEELGVPRKNALPLAANVVDVAMTNYKRHERAMIFNDLGIIGDMMAPLTSFMLNYHAQMLYYAKEGFKGVLRGEPRYAKPLMYFIAAQYIMAGTQGLPYREDWDALIQLMKNHGYWKASWPNATQFLINMTNQVPEGAGRDAARYGAFGLTGTDVSASFSASRFISSDLFTGALPVITKMGEVGGAMAGAAGAAATGKFTSTDAAGLARQLPGLPGLAAEKMTQDPKTGIIPDPNKAMEGTVRRPTDPLAPEWVKRYVGGRDTKESTERNAIAQAGLAEKARESQQKLVLEKIKKLALDGKPIEDEVKKYSDLGGDPTALGNEISRTFINKNTTRMEREGMKAGTANMKAIRRYQMMRELMGK